MAAAVLAGLEQVMGRQRTEAHMSAVTACEEKMTSGALLPSGSRMNPPHGQNPCSQEEFWEQGNLWNVVAALLVPEAQGKAQEMRINADH